MNNRTVIRTMLAVLFVNALSLILALGTIGCASSGAKPNTPGLSDPNFASDTPTQLGRKLVYKILVKMDWIGTASVLVIILGGIAIFAGHSAGIKILGAGFIGLVTYFTILRYSDWIPFIGLIGAAALTAYILLVRARGWKETVESVNVLLDKIPKDVLNKSWLQFGEEMTEEKIRAHMVEILRQAQPSDTTHLLVRQIKNQIQFQQQKAESWFKKTIKRVLGV